MKAYERFLKYVTYDTTSDSTKKTCPSTPGQLILSKDIADEMKAMGISDVRMDEHGYVYGHLPASKGCEAIDPIGFIAHVDTSDAVSGKDIKARIVKDYDGNDILLNSELNLVLSPEQYKEMLKYKGHDLIVTDGTTLLGADDKAGVAEIMTCAEMLLLDNTKKHGKICIGFTPDEEIGRGADLFDIKKFGASYAYTVDGGPLGDVEYENFNAAGANVKINGLSVHPGGAKNIMKNAILIAYEFNALLPPCETPSHTEGREGFYHLCEIRGNEELTTLHYILRDHDTNKLDAKKIRMHLACDYINKIYGAGTVDLKIHDSYRNMGEMLKPNMHIVERANRAYAAFGYTPTSHAIRGGTDGARLSYMGLLCPNIATGGHNAHGRFEYASVNEMEKMASILVYMACDISR